MEIVCERDALSQTIFVLGKMKSGAMLYYGASRMKKKWMMITSEYLTTM